MSYVDGFVIPMAATKIARYRKVARIAAKVWMEHGALQYIEAVGDDLAVKRVQSYPRLTNAKRGETVVFAWILYKSKAHRDRVNKKVMADPRIKDSMVGCEDLFDMKRMTYGGFKVIVEAGP